MNDINNPNQAKIDEWTQKLEEMGYSDIGVVDWEPNFEPGEHTHDQQSIHVILSGELTIIDADGETTYKAGDVVEFPAGTRHSTKGGNTPGSMLVGIKYT